MNQWFGFFKKEWFESIKTYKLLLVVVIFSILGILNPFTAKITPALLEQLMPAGTILDLPAPTALDSWLQFYKNVPQMGLVVFILLFSTMMSKELEKGTLVILLTKGLRRSTVITTKYMMALCYWTLAIGLSFIITYAYTAYYWDQSELQHLFFAASCLYVFGLLLLAVTLWGNTYFATSYGGIVVTFIAMIGLFITAIFPQSKSWNPLELATAPPQLLTGDLLPTDVFVSYLLTLGLAFVFVVLTAAHFKRKLV
ncbi:ABC transporter permease subunit [Sporosarcina sp. GW1-11]|uniref:ABC transporter permease n=1 Tax=Sporosarcina sp. GW1-11 TaxID=2899126 RepID=UPI00294E5531|nr:ABC transporter permease subunit [Sporosarcina sp. GW1-11]MDV6377249.1 ABC transporter permease subunit [Sporosarcina sp. GW1-11]